MFLKQQAEMNKGGGGTYVPKVAAVTTNATIAALTASVAALAKTGKDQAKLIGEKSLQLANLCDNLNEEGHLGIFHESDSNVEEAVVSNRTNKALARQVRNPKKRPKNQRIKFGI